MSRIAARSSLLAACVLGLTVPCAVHAQAAFRGLGFLPGEPVSQATAVSADGSVVVGHSGAEFFGFGTEAFRWTAAGGMVGLGDLPGGDFESAASDVSADGSVVVGVSLTELGPEAFRWTEATGMVGLGNPPGCCSSRAMGVSADGSVVVGTFSGPDGPEAFRWTEAEGMVGLGSLPSPFGTSSGATAVSADGLVIVGESRQEAFRWTVAGGMVGLGDLPGGSVDSDAYDVSADGSVVVGQGDVGPGSGSGFEAFRWTAAGGMESLGALSDVALGVSDDGSIVVGRAQALAFPFESFVWNPGDGLRNLYDLLPAGEIEGWFLLVEAISGDGRTVVGWGWNPSEQMEAWIAVPGPTPCDDAIDNDGDGLTDFPADPGCAAINGSTESPECDDQVDNDEDGLVDFPADLGCAAASGLTESSQCSDEIDNDDDGFVDFPEDVGCTDADDLLEGGECRDGLDNDGDGLVDLSDPGCEHADDGSERTPSLACDDGSDNDGDGAIDFPADDGCVSADARSEIRVDLDFDGLVDEGDRAAFARSFGQSEGDPGYLPEADFDGDGRITIPDYQRWLALYELALAAQPLASGCGLLGLEPLAVVLAARALRRRRH